VFILRIGGGNTEGFRAKLLEPCPQLRPCIDSLDAAGLSCRHHSGALLFVYPKQFEDVSRAIAGGPRLHPFNIIIAESLEYLLEEVLAEMPCRQRPREKGHSRRELVYSMVSGNGLEGSGLSADELVAQSVDWMHFGFTDHGFSIERTFLCTAPDLKNPHSVAQSTTEVIIPGIEESAGHYGHPRGRNPRRVA